MTAALEVLRLELHGSQPCRPSSSLRRVGSEAKELIVDYRHVVLALGGGILAIGDVAFALPDVAQHAHHVRAAQLELVRCSTVYHERLRRTICNFQNVRWCSSSRFVGDKS